MNYLCRMKSEIIILGTGNALVTRCYNTCFALRDENTTLLVDAGGGNGILRQLREANIAIGEIHDMFVTHAHTDHIIGALWVIRMFIYDLRRYLNQVRAQIYWSRAYSDISLR